MLLKNDINLEELQYENDKLEHNLEELKEIKEQFVKIIKNDNIKKLTDVEKFAIKLKEIAEEIEKTNKKVITLQAVIEQKEEFIANTFFKETEKMEKILQKFEENLDKILEEKLKKVAEKRIEVYQKNTIDVFNKFYNILKNNEEKIEKIVNEIEEDLENLKKEIELIKIYTKDIRMSKTQKITTIFLILSVFVLSFASINLYKKINNTNKQIYQIEQALIILNKNQKSILQLLIKH